MYEFKPTSWDEVRPYDTITFNVEVNPTRKPRLRRMVLTRMPHLYKDSHSVEHGMAALTGYHVTKSGERSKAYRRYTDDYVSARIGLVVSVQRHGEAPADVTPVEPTPAPVKPLTPAMQRAVETLKRDGYVDTVDGYTVGTLVGLMDRGIVRPALSLANGLSAGRHYPTTTPAQVWDEAHAMHLDECDRIAQERDAREEAELEADGGWGQPDGMLSTPETAPNLKPGDLVQRVGEEGPDKPVGKVLEVREWPIVGVLVKVTFEGAAAVQKQVKELVKVPPPCCSSTTQGGITTHEDHCPRFARPAEPIRDVHTSHCCKRHGCKYGYGNPEREAKCTVASGRAPQEYPCEMCEDDPAPTVLADDMAALRTMLLDLCDDIRTLSGTCAPAAPNTRRRAADLGESIVTALDRIAAQMPQRAIDTLNGAPLWLHPGCGWTTNVQPGPALTRCVGCKVHTDQWQALYIIVGDAR